LFVQIGPFRSILVPVGTCWSRVLLVGTCWSILVHVGTCWSVVVHSGPCWYLLVNILSMLVLVGTCWSILVQIGPCWYLLVQIGLYLVHIGFFVLVGPCWYLWVLVGTNRSILVHIGTRKYSCVPSSQMKFKKRRTDLYGKQPKPQIRFTGQTGKSKLFNDENLKRSDKPLTWLTIENHIRKEQQKQNIEKTNKEINKII
jgi:hypothetical protein